MKKELTYLLLFVFLFSALAINYSAFHFYFNGSDINQKYSKNLEKKVKRLELALKNKAQGHVSEGQRGLASISQKEISLNEIYIENLKNLKNSRNVTEDQLRSLSQKILQSSPKSETLAESYYLIADLNCNKLKKEDECLEQIETLVSQFPESSWTGRGLFLLGQLYLKMNRSAEASAVMTVIKNEFAKDQDLVQQVKSVEKMQY